MILITFTRAYPWQSVLMVGALLLAGLAEGSSLSVLLPILSIAVDADSGSQSEFARIVTQVLERAGITPVISNLLVVAVLGVVLVTELLNSAVEAVVDRIGPEHHELAGRAKDMGSAAVMIAIGLVVIVWLLVGLNRLPL